MLGFENQPGPATRYRRPARSQGDGLFHVWKTCPRALRYGCQHGAAIVTFPAAVRDESEEPVSNDEERQGTARAEHGREKSKARRLAQKDTGRRQAWGPQG